MPHLFYSLDYTVAVFIVHDSSILLIHHRELDAWLPIGGHIELGEDPEEAVLREVSEECGLEIEILGDRPPMQFSNIKVLHAPAFLDVHPIKGEHRHLGMIYFAKATSKTIVPDLNSYYNFHWFTHADLDSDAIVALDSVRYYAQEAIRRVASIATS